MAKKNKITIVGSGYVGMSLAVLFAQHNDVIILDVDPLRVDLVNKNLSTVADKEIEFFLAKKNLSLKATLDKIQAYKDADFVVLATPTNFDYDANFFDTSSVDQVISDALKYNEDTYVVIKSTVPVGYTKAMQEKHGTKRIIFSPEFLREGQALKDNLYPSRIIIGSYLKAGKDFASLLKQGAKEKNIETLYLPPTEAEAVKLFSNTYLAMRVSFFNELDSYALANNLDTKSIIDGVSLDKRIGEGYNNPSFGYGGYCLPKDTKQLLASYKGVPQKLIQAIVSSNSTRKDFITNEILKLKPNVLGIYRLIMKEGSDNYRFSAVHGIIERVKLKGVKVIIFEPEVDSDEFYGSKVIADLNEFKKRSDLIIANRMDDHMKDVDLKCFSRDLFKEN